MGDWLPKSRRWWLVSNLVVGNVLMVFTYANNRAKFVFLPQLWVGLQCVFLSVALAVITHRLNNAHSRISKLVER